MITIFSPDGIGEIGVGADLTDVILQSVATDPQGPLRNGDIVVVTSKIVSKAEGRFAPADQREAVITAASRRTVAARGRTRIVANELGLVMAAAGVDNSNVASDRVLLLPVDPDGTAAGLRDELARRGGVDVGVLVSDTMGRAWRDGQIDLAIGAAGVLVADDFGGRRDSYGNDLVVTRIACADELAAAAELAKTKLGGRPIAVIRGLSHLVGPSSQRAADLVRPPATDMFAYGSRESVLLATLASLGLARRYEELVALEPEQRIDAVLSEVDVSAETAGFIRRLLSVDLGVTATPAEPG